MFGIDRLKILELMEKLSISQRALALAVHISQPHVNDILQGRKPASLNVACCIAKELKLKINDIVKEVQL